MFCAPPPARPLSRDAGRRGTRPHPLQRLQHPVPVVERPGAQEREGQACVPAAVLRGGLAGHGQREGGCRGHVHVQPLQEGQEHAAEDQL